MALFIYYPAMFFQKGITQTKGAIGKVMVGEGRTMVVGSKGTFWKISYPDVMKHTVFHNEELSYNVLPVAFLFQAFSDYLKYLLNLEKQAPIQWAIHIVHIRSVYYIDTS